MKLEHKIILALSCIVVILGFYLYLSIKNNRALEKIYAQNQLAHDSTMKVLQIENETFYQRYAYIESNLTEKEKALKKKDEKILVLTQANIQLNNIISSSTGHIIETGKDSGSVAYGTKLEFKDSTEFYQYKDTVTIAEKPFMKRHLAFSPFSQKVFLTRNIEGKWSGYIKFGPEWINKYLVISGLEVFVERDEFVRVETDIDKFRLSLIPMFGLLQKDNTLLGAGIKALINKKHLIEVTKGIGNDWLWIGYGYKFDIIK